MVAACSCTSFLLRFPIFQEPEDNLLYFPFLSFRREEFHDPPVRYRYTCFCLFPVHQNFKDLLFIQRPGCAVLTQLIRLFFVRVQQDRLNRLLKEYLLIFRKIGELFSADNSDLSCVDLSEQAVPEI